MSSLRGHLLIASPLLPDSNFFRSVVLIIHHDEDGAFGLLLNRPTNNTLADVWETAEEWSGDVPASINSGGPVEGPLMALHTSEECSENEVIPGVHFAAHKDHLNRIVIHPEHAFRIFSGYSGWAPGQLEAEMEQGGWMTLPARYEHIFGDADAAWKAASGEFGEQITGPLLKSVSAPEDPSCN